jgi:hypothetical protein
MADNRPSRLIGLFLKRHVPGLQRTPRRKRSAKFRSRKVSRRSKYYQSRGEAECASSQGPRPPLAPHNAFRLAAYCTSCCNAATTTNCSWLHSPEKSQVARIATGIDAHVHRIWSLSTAMRLADITAARKQTVG